MTTEQMIGLGLIGVAALVMRRRSKGAGGSRLDRTIFRRADTPFTERNLYQSVLILGAAGSGKTSGSGRHFQGHILSIRDSAGLIISSKPEDRPDTIEAFKKHGRLDDLTILGPNDSAKLNFLDALGGDPNNLTNGIEVLAEMANRNKSGSKEPFWERERRRTFYQAFVILQNADAQITGTTVQKLISGAATQPQLLNEEGFRKTYHWLALERARIKQKPHRQRYDFEQAYAFWTQEWPRMADKTRSNVMAECMGVLHTLNSGVVRDLIGTATTFKPSMFEEGKWLLIDMPLQFHGESGRFVGAAAKYIVQRYILARTAKPESGPICVWIDECHNYITSYDALTLAEQRSHRGVAVYLTQGVNAVFDLIGEKSSKALFTNFGTKIFHQVGSPEDDAYGSGLLGQHLDITTGGSPDEQGGFRANFNEHWQPILQPGVFLSDQLRAAGGVAPAIVISGEKFKSGHRYALIPFKQE